MNKCLQWANFEAQRKEKEHAPFISSQVLGGNLQCKILQFQKNCEYHDVTLHYFELCVDLGSMSRRAQNAVLIEFLLS